MRIVDAIGVVGAAGIAAVWGLYPLAVAGVARLRSRPRIAEGTSPSTRTVTVVIATRDDEASVRARVLDCLAADYPPDRLDVVVAVDAAGGGTMTALDVPRTAVVLSTAEPGKSAALNVGVSAAGGEILVFTDTHQRFASDAIARLVAALDDPAVGAVSGALMLPESARGASPVELYWRYERWLREREAALHSSVGVTGAIYAMRRALWSPLPAGLILDDVFTPMRVVLGGHRVGFEPAAIARETRRAAPGQEYRRKVRTLTGVLQLCAWLPGILVPWRDPIWAQFVFHKLLRLLTPYFALAVALWAAVRSLEWLVRHPSAAVGLAAAAAAVVALVVVSGRARLLARVGDAVTYVVTLQAAVVVATANGVRGRWDVWQR